MMGRPTQRTTQAVLDDPALGEALAAVAATGRLSDEAVRAMRARRRRTVGAGAAAVLVATLGLGLWQQNMLAPASNLAQHIETRRGEQRAVQLADGSKVELDGGTSLDVRFDGKSRVVELRRGEAYFDVAHEQDRPFIVRAGESSTRVLGTAFSIDKGQRAVKLNVYRGKVRFGDAAGGSRNVEVPAGWRSSFARGVPAMPTRFDATQQEWRQSWVDTDDMVLGELIEQLNRRGGPLIAPPPPRLASLPLSGRFKLDEAQQLKRAAVGAQDNIVATDIAAFPDLNLAEALQRIPGITITRDTGEGRQIALRGLGADFTRTQLNGMEVLGNTASGMDNRGNVSRTRSFDYSLFASELFNRVTVQKSYSAEQDEGGIAGTVQLTTAKPFDYEGTKFVLSAKGQTNTNTSGVTPRVVGLASGNWGDFGALVSVAYSNIRSDEYGYRNWGWGLTRYNAANIGPEIDAATRAKLVSGVWQSTAQSPSSWYTDRKRLGVTSALQYHPGDRFKLDVDLLYGRLWDKRDDYALATAGANPLTGTTIGGTQIIRSAVIDDTNTLRAASFTGIDLRSEHHIVENHADFYQAVANASWDVSDRLTVHALAGFEESDFAQPVFDKVFMEAKNTAFSYDIRPTVPVNSYGINLTDPNVWALQRLDVQENEVVNRYTNGQLDAAYRLDDTLTLKLGGEYKAFVNSGYTWANKVFHNVPAVTPIPNDLKQTVPVDTLLQYIVGDVDGSYAFIGDKRDLTSANLQAGSDYRVEEDTWAGFVQLDLDTQLAGMRLRANAGVRYYSTDLTSSANLATGAGFTPVSIRTNSKGWLPAANVALDVARDVVVRVSGSRNVNRPGLGDLAAAGSITTRPNGGSLSLGNPFLEPYKATSVEGSVEWYMDRHGFASIGVFYKSMDSFVTSSSKQIPYGETGLPLSLLIQGQDANTPYDVSQPINGPGADIKGVEIAFQHDFTFLPGALKNIGVAANGTWFDGHRTAFYTTAGVTSSRVLPLDNLSKWAFNATLYYENPVWGVRVSNAYRDRYLTGAGNALANSGGGIKATNNVDFQAHVNVLPGVRLIAEGINLTNEPIQQFSSLLDARRTEVYTTSGRTFTFGFSAEF